MQKIIIVLTLVFISFAVYGQVDPVEKEILDFDESKSSIISKGRNLLLERFLENDLTKVKEIKNYLTGKAEDENHIALFPPEYWLILYWTNEYDEITKSITEFDSAKVESYNTRIRPPYDLLYEKLRTKTVENFETLKDQIEKSNQGNESKNFLLLNLKYLTSDTQKDEFIQDTLNTDADNFIKTFPESDYEDFTRNYIRYKLVPKKWGMAFEFFSGYGIYTGQLSESYTNNIPFGVAFDICYKKFELYLRDYIGFNKTKKDFDYSLGTWEKGSRTMVFLPEASIGYVTLDNDRLKVSPFAGIGVMDISPPTDKTEEIPELEEVSLEFTTTYMLGVNLDIKFGKNNIPAFRPKTSYGFMRIRYAFNIPQFENKYTGAAGKMHYITIGFGGFARGAEREY